MQKIIFISIILTGFILVGHAQSITITGKVLDNEGLPLPGATIQLDNHSDMTVSEADGQFVIGGIPSDCSGMEVSFLGFRSVHLHLDPTMASKELVIVLEPFRELLDEVVIRDQYVEDRKNESSQNLEIVKEEFLNRNLGNSLMQSLERLPGVSSMQIGSGQSKPVIRGLGFNRVLVLENGIRHEAQQWGADHGLEIDQFAVEQVEVIKGPASLVHGSDAIGGIIDIQPGIPPHHHSFGGKVQGIYRSNNDYLGTSVEAYIRNDHWYAKWQGSYAAFSDYRIPADTVSIYSFLVPLPDGRLRNTAGRENGLHGQFGYLSDRFNSVFYLSRVATDQAMFANAHGLEPRLVDTAAHDRSFRDMLFPSQQVVHWKITNRTSLQAGPQRFELEIGYQQNQREEHNDYVNHGYMPDYFPDSLGIPQTLERLFHKDIGSLNLKSSYSAGNHEIQYGWSSEIQQNQVGGWSFIIPGYRQWTNGWFVYDRLEWSDHWMFHAGLRYDLGTLAVSEYRDWFPSGDAPLLRAAEKEFRFGQFSWGLGMNYNRDHFHFKAHAGKSFRMPIAKELAANGVNYHNFAYEKGDTNLRAESAYQLDLSFEWHRKRWALQLSPFVNFFPNYIYLNPTADYDLLYGAGNQIFEYRQSQVLRAGGEWHAHVNVYRGLRLGLIGEYLIGRQLSGDKAGFPLPFSPPPKTTISVSYHPEIMASMPDAYISLDYTIVGAQDQIVPPERKTPGYQLVDLMVGSEMRTFGASWKWHLTIRNLLNVKYLNHTSFYRLIEAPEAGRNVSVSLQIPFHKGWAKSDQH